MKSLNHIIQKSIGQRYENIFIFTNLLFNWGCLFVQQKYVVEFNFQTLIDLNYIEQTNRNYYYVFVGSLLPLYLYYLYIQNT